MNSLRDAIANVAVLSLSQSLRVPEELSRQGATPAQLVREHQLEVFAESFPCWIAAFATLYCLLSPVALGLFVWLCVSFALELNAECDVPLQLWTIVVFASSGYDLLHIMLLRYICHHDTSGSRPLPLYVRAYMALIGALEVSWLVVGVCFTAAAETCEGTAPGLFQSVRAYAIFSVFFDLLVGINAMGLYTIMNWMLRRGMLSTRNAAPSGTLDRMRIVAFDASSQLFRDTPECCICLAAFDASAEIREASGCGHVFHTRCLGNWFAVNRTCPLCRQDLAAAAGRESSAQPSGIIGHIVGRSLGP